MRLLKIDWNAVDWTKEDWHLAACLDVTRTTVQRYRKQFSDPAERPVPYLEWLQARRRKAALLEVHR